MEDPKSDIEIKSPIADGPVDILQRLIRFNTSNPPGNEYQCIDWIDTLLSTAGFETTTYAIDETRPNLVARFSTNSNKPPLLFYGHVDVVGVEEDQWSYPPFDAVIEDGFVWGRGALDMKGGLSMMISAAIKAVQSDLDLNQDLILVFFADEEDGGEKGAKYMIEQHQEVFQDVQHAIGEFGGFSMEIAGQRFYPIQMSEKSICRTKLNFSGSAGHGSLPTSGTAISKMGRAVSAIDSTRLPVRITPTVEKMIGEIATQLSGEKKRKFTDLMNSSRTNDTLDQMDEYENMFDALLHNTANPTIVEAGKKVNVIPNKTSVTLDCRLLPSCTKEDIFQELRNVIPDNIEYTAEVLDYQEFSGDVDSSLFPLLSDILHQSTAEGFAFPFVSFGATDARYLSEIGIQSYGFTPMDLPPDMEFLELLHAPDERIPVTAVTFGTTQMFELICRYSGEF